MDFGASRRVGCPAVGARSSYARARSAFRLRARTLSPLVHTGFVPSDLGRSLTSCPGPTSR
jgi:hypothetical protein